jgi:hypothetical protein
MPNEMPEVSNCDRIEVVHHSQIATSSNITVECIELSLWRRGVLPKPVFHINAPIHNIRVIDVLGQPLTKASTDGTEGRAEVSCC